jgi:inorganic pyrophosphatase
MNIWHDIDPKRITKEQFIAVVEIARGSKNKYELDKETGFLRLDRILYTSTHYPANYGFIPLTYAEDNDPLDVLILASEAIAPLSLVECRPIGVLQMIDKGENDEKIIAVPIGDPHYNSFHNITDLPAHIFKEIQHFYTVYKMLEEYETKVEQVDGKEVAQQIIQKCLDAYKKKFKK